MDQVTVVPAAWLQDIDDVVYRLLGASAGPGGAAPTTRAEIMLNLGAAYQSRGIVSTGLVTYSSDTTLTVANAGQAIFFTGTAASTFTLPAANALPFGEMKLTISNAGSAALTITPAAGDGSDLQVPVLQPGQQVILVNDGGIVWRTIAQNSGTTSPFTVGAAQTSTQAVARGQLAQYTPIGATNSGTGVTTLSVSTTAFTAPCDGKAIVIFSGANSSIVASALSISASLAGFVQSYALAFGPIYDGLGYLPMAAGQSSTFTLTGESSSSAGIFLGIKVLFQPLA